MPVFRCQNCGERREVQAAGLKGAGARIVASKNLREFGWCLWLGRWFCSPYCLARCQGRADQYGVVKL